MGGGGGSGAESVGVASTDCWVTSRVAIPRNLESVTLRSPSPAGEVLANIISAAAAATAAAAVALALGAKLSASGAVQTGPAGNSATARKLAWLAWVGEALSAASGGEEDGRGERAVGRRSRAGVAGYWEAGLGLMRRRYSWRRGASRGTSGRSRASGAAWRAGREGKDWTKAQTIGNARATSGKQ